MRLFVLSLLLILGALCANGGAAAAPSATIDKSPAADKIEQVDIAPHRAIYDMRLSSVKNGSTIGAVSGTMMFEWADACDGWAIQQNLHLHFNYAEGDESEVSSNEVTWESKDGKRYNFNIRRVQDGKETENYRGKAALAGGAFGKATYGTPANKTVDFAAETVFPSTHTKMIIAKARSGERFFTRRVFDGTDETGSDDVSVFISPPKAQALEAHADPKLDQSPLLAATAWPVHMAFFKIDDATGEPDYEMDLVLLGNGVARSMKIDYGDFSVTGTLKAIEPLPAPHC